MSQFLQLEINQALQHPWLLQRLQQNKACCVLVGDCVFVENKNAIILAQSRPWGGRVAGFPRAGSTAHTSGHQQVIITPHLSHTDPLSEAWRSFSAALQHLPPPFWTQLSLGGQGVCSSNIHLCEVWGYQVPVLGPSARPHVSWASSR